MKGTGMPVEILTQLNEMAGLGPDEEIDLYEVISQFWVLCSCSINPNLIFNSYLTHPIKCQEIKFEPSVMCEPIDKKISFRNSQVCEVNMSNKALEKGRPNFKFNFDDLVLIV